MKTIIEYTNGLTQTYEDIAPTVNVDGENTVDLIDDESTNIGDSIPFSLIKRVIFEP